MPENRRKLVRLEEYNYSDPGYYFVTICTENREEFFGEIRNEKMCISAVGNVVYECWNEIPKHFPNVSIDVFVVMPDHVHGIVMIEDEFFINEKLMAKKLNKDKDIVVRNPNVGAADLPPLRIRRANMILPRVIHGFKSSVTRIINKQFPNTSFAWQRSYYDRIIRNDREYAVIAEYIENNPKNWEPDREDKKLMNEFFRKFEEDPRMHFARY
ncbi:transposase [Candidatus Peregrinibacteria bacterium]|nr:transposase [Candidatus Peregrinibacteria bacterium]